MKDDVRYKQEIDISVQKKDGRVIDYKLEVQDGVTKVIASKSRERLLA